MSRAAQGILLLLFIGAYTSAAALAIGAPGSTRTLTVIPQVALSVVAAGAFAWIGGRATRADAETWWTPTPAKVMVGLGLAWLVTVIADQRVGLVVSCPLAVGYLFGRGHTEASDAAFASVALAVMMSLLSDRVIWDTSPWWPAPILLVAISFVARELWDLVVLRASAEQTPEARAASRWEFSRFLALTGVGVAGALALGWYRSQAGPLRTSTWPVPLAAALFLLGVAGLVILIRAQKKPEAGP